VLRAALACQLKLFVHAPRSARARELVALLDVAEVARLGTVAIDNGGVQLCLTRVSERRAARTLTRPPARCTHSAHTRAPLTATRLSPCGANRLLYFKQEAALAEALHANGLPGLLREAIAQGKGGRLQRAGHCPPGQQCVRDRRLGDYFLQAKKEWALQHNMPLLDGSEDAAQILDDSEREEGEERHFELAAAASSAAGAAGAASAAGSGAALAIDANELRALGGQAAELAELLQNVNGHTLLSRSVKEVPATWSTSYLPHVLDARARGSR
jgi:hypothetical protein